MTQSVGKPEERMREPGFSLGAGTVFKNAA